MAQEVAPRVVVCRVLQRPLPLADEENKQREEGYTKVREPEGLTYWMSPEAPATMALLSQGVNEILFPVGYSLVLFAATVLGKRVEV